MKNTIALLVVALFASACAAKPKSEEVPPAPPELAQAMDEVGGSDMDNLSEEAPPPEKPAKKKAAKKAGKKKGAKKKKTKRS